MGEAWDWGRADLRAVLCRTAGCLPRLFGDAPMWMRLQPMCAGSSLWLTAGAGGVAVGGFTVVAGESEFGGQGEIVLVPLGELLLVSEAEPTVGHEGIEPGEAHTDWRRVVACDGQSTGRWTGRHRGD